MRLGFVETEKLSLEDCKECIFGTKEKTRLSCDLKYTNFHTKCATLDEPSGKCKTFYFVLEEA